MALAWLNVASLNSALSKAHLPEALAAFMCLLSSEMIMFCSELGSHFPGADMGEAEPK